MTLISFNPVSIIAILIILVTLIYSYFKYRLDNKQKTEEQKRQNSKQEDTCEVIPVITAVVAVLMEQKPFKIKNIVVGKKEDISGWRLFGRQEIMRRRYDMHR